MISSGALPNVAFRKPPMPGPVWCAACSVASPISQASGMSASGGEHEERDVAERSVKVEHDDERPERQQGEEDAAHQGAATLSSGGCSRRALRLGGHALPFRLRRGAARGGLGGRPRHARARRPARATRRRPSSGSATCRSSSSRRRRGDRVSGADPRAPWRASASSWTTRSSIASSTRSTRPGHRRGSWATTPTRSSTRSGSAGCSPGSSRTPSTRLAAPSGSRRHGARRAPRRRRLLLGGRHAGSRDPPHLSRRPSTSSGSNPTRRSSSATVATRTCRGAKELGMTTVQAVWFRADDDERGLEPDFEAFTPMDVLNVVRRLTRRALAQRRLHRPARPVKTCGEPRSVVNNPGYLQKTTSQGPSCRSDRRRRPSAGGARFTATRSSTPPPASSAPAPSSTRTRSGDGRTSGACRRSTRSRSTSSSSTRRGVGRAASER